jgi:hypothetical protein
MKTKDALKTIGMPEGFVLRNVDDFEEMHRVWRMKTAAAKDGGDVEREKELNGAWAFLKKKQGRWCACGRIKSIRVSLCPDCYRAGKGPPLALPEWVEGMVRDDIPIPGRVGGKIEPILRQLENVGDTLVIVATHEAIRHIAARLGIKLTMRALTNPGSGTAYRVWRTDGLKADEVNRIIQQRKERQKHEDTFDSFTRNGRNGHGVLVGVAQGR